MSNEQLLEQLKKLPTYYNMFDAAYYQYSEELHQAVIAALSAFMSKTPNP
jgi:tRNA threonylcarbamoyladenosine modification (KEOPS) complex Cgi121 subunit